MLPSGERQPKVIEPMQERHAGDGDAERVGIGEVRQALLSRRMLLAEDHVALRAVQCLPGPHPALQSAARSCGEVAMTTQHLGHDADRAQTGHRLQHGDNLTVPDRCQRIRPAASARGLLLGWQPGIGIKPGTGRDAERRLGGSGLARVGSTEVHVQSHLLIRDVIAGHRGSLLGS